MTFKKRRRVFYGLLALFLVVGAGVVSYVQGWRLDLAHLEITKVGGVFIHSFPENANIYLDGKSIKNKTGLFQKGTLINDLFPKNYELKLAVDGYKDWRENISVYPSLVTEIKQAVLVAKKSAIVATGSVQNFWIVNGGIITQTASDGLYFGNKKLRGKEIVEWSNDGKIILTKGSNESYFWHYTDNNQFIGINISSLLKNLGMTASFKILLDPQNNQKIILYDNAGIYSLDPISKKLQLLDKINGARIGNMAFSESRFAWTKFNLVSNTSTIVIFDRSAGEDAAETSVPGKTSELKWLGNGNLSLLQNDGNLYVFGINDNKLTNISNSVRKSTFTDDGSAVSAIRNDSLEIFSLNMKNYHRFNFPNANDIINTFWYEDQKHLFIIYADKVVFLDLNDANLENVIPVAQTQTGKYDIAQNNFYFLSGGNLFMLEFPKP